MSERDETRELIAALHAAAAAMNSLAESNRQIVDYLVASEADDDPDAMPTRHLDGTPITL